MPRLATILLAAVLAAGCGGDDEQREQLRPGELTTLSARVAALRDAIVAGERIPALDAAVALRETVDRLGPRLAADEERALRVAVQRLSARIRADIPPPAEPEEDLIPLPKAEDAEAKPGKAKGRAHGKGGKKGKD